MLAVWGLGAPLGPRAGALPKARPLVVLELLPAPDVVRLGPTKLGRGAGAKGATVHAQSCHLSAVARAASQAWPPTWPCLVARSWQVLHRALPLTKCCGALCCGAIERHAAVPLKSCCGAHGLLYLRHLRLAAARWSSPVSGYSIASWLRTVASINARRFLRFPVWGEHASVHWLPRWGGRIAQ